MEIFMGKDALNKAIKVINKKFKLFKILVVENEENLKQCENFNNILTKNVERIEHVVLPSNIKSSEILLALIKSKLTEDVGLIIVEGNTETLNSVLSLNSKVKLMNIVCEPMLYMFWGNQDYIVADDDIIKTCNNKSIANCYGFLCANCFNILEIVFNKAVYLKEINPLHLLEIEKYMQNLLTYPSAILKSELGKIMLLKMCLKLSELLNKTQVINSFTYNLAINIQNENKYKNLQIGEALMISSCISFKLLGVLVGAKHIRAEIGFNAYSRIKKLGKQIPLSKYSESFCNENNIESRVFNFRKLQPSINVVFYTYLDMMRKMLKTFRELYLDKGICLNKFLKTETLLSSVNMIPETSNQNCFASFIRDVGLLNKFWIYV